VRFGTLHDYYKAVRESIGQSAGITNSSREEVLDSFPTLTGDFFTYADRYSVGRRRGWAVRCLKEERLGRLMLEGGRTGQRLRLEGGGPGQTKV